jgi:phage baseplate assembly protein W
MPKFGTNLKKFIFEPNDGFTENGIRSEITEAVTIFMPNLRINNVLIDRESEGDYIATVQIDYTITEDTFKTNDLVTIKL